MTNLFVNVSFNCIYYYSKCQIFFINIRNNFNLFIETTPALLKLKNDINSLIKYKPGKVLMYEFIKDGKITEFCDFDSVNKPDLMIFSWLDNDKKCVNKKIIYENGCTNVAEVSDIKFMLTEIKIGESESHKIDLKTDKFNYYLVGNKFTKGFFIFYLKQYLEVDNIGSDTQMTLKMIDHDVNKVKIDFTDKNESILLEKNGYKLIITNHTDNE
jgi:uncharacterized protein YegJ (DUF2314 family)